jgi:hypothetical protein
MALDLRDNSREAGRVLGRRQKIAETLVARVPVGTETRLHALCDSVGIDRGLGVYNMIGAAVEIFEHAVHGRHSDEPMPRFMQPLLEKWDAERRHSAGL